MSVIMVDETHFIRGDDELRQFLRDVLQRLSNLEGLCNGFKWRERILGGAAVFLLGVVLSQAASTLERRDKMLRFELEMNTMQREHNSLHTEMAEVKDAVNALLKYQVDNRGLYHGAVPQGNKDSFVPDVHFEADEVIKQLSQ